MSSAVPPSPYTTTARNQSMPAVPTQAQAQRTPPLSQVPVIVPMYGTPPTTTTSTTAAQALQQTPSSVRRVPPPAYRSHSYQDPSELDAAGGEYHARAPDPSDVEKGESPYAAQVAAETGKPVGAPHARVQRAAPTSTGPQPPTPTRPLHQHSLSSYSTTGRTQQPSPPASTTGSNNNNNNNMYNNYPPHSSSPQQIHQGSSPSPPFKYDSHHPGQQIHRVNSRQLLGEGKTRTPDRTLPFKEEADNDEHDHDHRAQHRLSGNWDYAPDPHPQQVYLPPQVQPPHPPYGGLAVSVPDDTNTAVDDTDTDSDSDLPPQHQHQTHVHHPRNLAELKNMSHHLQEPSEGGGGGGVGGTSSSGTPRSPTNGLPHQQQQQQFAPIGMGFAGHHQQQQPPLPHHQQMVDLRTLPAHVQQMIAHQQQHGGDGTGTGTGSMMSSTSSAYPMAHVQYDITTNQFDPEVFRETTVAQLTGEYGNGNRKTS
ncbi:hypothetical protein EXIGLDRAFT_206928 [Exidia glandulosa HHB12029]|uniref:Uncharacterized protein n=1 Tax=Exidia glandulosa HHB12029 TaxID=1314781 RepID=A0A165ELZ5_EXIGL|nr:hypothetical protein EXIGLDRAFT_206928 [Exidia glandulosa HHB12029]